MTILTKTYFADTISHLRNFEEVILYNRIVDISADEEMIVINFLQEEYKNECLEYPYEAPVFDENASLWGAKILYFASQLLLYRENKESEIPGILSAYEYSLTPSSILSADLCLRFLPQILLNSQLIDPEDILISVLKNHLQTWHYSGVNYLLDKDTLDFSVISSNKCLQQLYINRVIEYKSKSLAELPLIKGLVMASMGNYSGIFWKEL